jgi:hypothetical protein
MDGPFYVDTRSPHVAADIAAVTLTTTNKAIVPLANLPVLGANYFGWVGKAVRMRLWGRMTPVATPGNLGVALYWGTGGDANGTAVLSFAGGASSALTAGTSLTWEMDIICRCRAIGVSGALIAHAQFNANPSLMAASLQPLMIPASAPAQVTVDLTAANVLSPQMLATGSAGTTAQIHEFTFESLN